MKKNLFTSQLYIRQAVEYYEERGGQSDTSTDSEDTVSDEEE